MPTTLRTNRLTNLGNTHQRTKPITPITTGKYPHQITQICTIKSNQTQRTITIIVILIISTSIENSIVGKSIVRSSSKGRVAIK